MGTFVSASIMLKHNKLVLISLFCLSKICLAGYLTDEVYKNGFFGLGKRTLHYGTWHDDDGSTYTGYFKNDKAHGKGIYVDKNGNTYKGMFKNDKIHGKGTWIETDQGNNWPGTYTSDNWDGATEEIEGYGEY